MRNLYIAARGVGESGNGAIGRGGAGRHAG